MNRRDMMKLASLVMLPMMPGAAMASSDNKAPPLRYKVFTATRPGLNRDVPPGKEPLMWVANSATLIYGEQDAVLVDTFLTVEQCNGLADVIVASGKTLKAIYVTHAHGDHFFGIKVLQDRFPDLKALATPDVCRGKNEASDYAGKIEQPMAQAVPKSNSRSHFHRGSVGRQ